MNPESKTREKRRIFIFGAGDAGHSAYHALTFDKDSPFEVVGFIDDAPNKHGKKLNGMKVLGNRHQIKALAHLYKVEEILLPAHNGKPEDLNEVVEICQKVGLSYRVFSALGDIDSVGQCTPPFRTLEFTDMLPLERTHSDRAAVKKVLADKTVLLNGSGGALGMELCRQILQLGCRRLIIVDRYESYLNELVASLYDAFSKGLIIPVLADTDKMEILEKVFESHQPDIVFQAGMRKYAPFLTLNLDDVVRDNYVRTFNLAKVASKFECEHFVMISSLVAAKNRNLTTDSLRIAEVSLEHFFSDTNTRFVIARICDIIENRGGTVSIIENQIRKQQTLTLPSAEAQIYLMSKYSATEFILQALVEKDGTASERRVLVCKPSSRILLSEVATKLASLYGLKLKADIQIKYSAQSKEHADQTARDIWPAESIGSETIQETKANTGVTGKDLESVFKNFVLSNNKKPTLQDWITQTRELIKQCGPDIFVSEP
jgi:FlaA1/EpsC-like NDP-sugar epimerase